MNIIQFDSNNGNQEQSRIIIRWIIDSFQKHVNLPNEILGQQCPFFVDEKIKPYFIELYRSYVLGLSESFSRMNANKVTLDKESCDLFLNPKEELITFPYFDKTDKLITLKFKCNLETRHKEFYSMFVSLNSVWAEVVDNIYPIVYKGQSRDTCPDFHSPEFIQDFIKHFNLKG